MFARRAANWRAAAVAGEQQRVREQERPRAANEWREGTARAAVAARSELEAPGSEFETPPVGCR